MIADVSKKNCATLLSFQKNVTIKFDRKFRQKSWVYKALVLSNFYFNRDKTKTHTPVLNLYYSHSTSFGFELETNTHQKN